MSATTSIEWTDATVNPIRARRIDTGKVGWHCEMVSAGCAKCYAQTFNGRGLPGGGTRLRYTKASRAQVETFVDEVELSKPTRWRKGRRVFVCSMTDLFGEWMADDQIDRVFAMMALPECGRHTFQILTKRAERMRAYIAGVPARWRGQWPLDGDWPLPNVHLGVSVEDQPSADDRIRHLLATQAAVRWISLEPMLAPVDLYRSGWSFLEPLRPPPGNKRGWERGLDWIVVGGESGPGARPCDVAWIRAIRDQCRGAGAPLFIKQLGARPVGSMCGDARVINLDWKLRIKDPKGGDMEEWPLDLRVREFPGGAR